MDQLANEVNKVYDEASYNYDDLGDTKGAAAAVCFLLLEPVAL